MLHQKMACEIMDENDEIDSLIDRLDAREDVKGLRVKERNILYALYELGMSERKAASVFKISRRYLRNLKKSAITKLRKRWETIY